MQSEILSLDRRHIDLEAGTLRLGPRMTKNDDGSVVYLTSELKTTLASQLERGKALERGLGRIVPYVFPHMGKGKRAGQPRHDFRRTAVRNMERVGVPRSVATKITGHRTESVYRRYAIVSYDALRLIGWPLYRVARFTSWCGHGQQFIPWSEAHGYWQLARIILAQPKSARNHLRRHACRWIFQHLRGPGRGSPHLLGLTVRPSLGIQVA
jgi:hypothetical protein